MDVKLALRVVTAILEYEELKDKQKEAIEACADRKDVFMSLPTGYGKSLCCQILPVLFDALYGHQTLSSIIVVVTAAQLAVDIFTLCGCVIQQD